MTTAVETPAKRGIGGMLVWVVLGLVAAGGGAVLPWVLHFPHDGENSAKKKPDETHAPKLTIVAFGDVIVNLSEDRLTRFLRVKILLVVDERQSKEIEEHLTTRKAHLKNWLIGYLADQTLAEVSRATGVNRIRREVRDQFNAMLFDDGSEKINEVLFDEFVVQ